MIIISFTSSEATLSNAGGKGANLARLTQAGFPVPPGFIIVTSAYRAYVESNQLTKTIRQNLDGLQANDTAGLEHASARIRAAFSSGSLPGEARAEILDAYAKLEGAQGAVKTPMAVKTPRAVKTPGAVGTPVAVRSSATTEDLPELSFAGQQDTFLNVCDEAELLRAVSDCWSSLWTARAIGYRLRNRIAQQGAGVAVVIQAMVTSQVSGVLFSANPLSGRRSEAVMDATFGLGEALVSGQVDPDHFVLDTRHGAIIQKTLGAKQVATHAKAGGGTQTVREDASGQQTLREDQILELAALGKQIESAFESPQDIEWALADGKLYVLQSRPITSLFPVPEVSFDPLIVWFSFAAVQGLVGPITPLGQDTIRGVAAGAGRIFGLQLQPDEQNLFVSAGERIWIRISDVIRNPIGVRIFEPALEVVEPSVSEILKSLAEEPELGRGSGKVRLSSILRLARFALPVLARLVRTMLLPEKGRAEFEALLESKIAQTRIPEARDRFGRLANTVAFIRDQVANALSFLLPKFIPVFGPSMAGLNLLKKIAGERQELTLEVTRALPGNVTTEMDLALWDTAQAIRADPPSRDILKASDAAVITSGYLKGELPTVAQKTIDRFMERYGMRGVGEIDFGQPTWREDPTPLVLTLKSYLEIDPDKGPQAQFKRGERAAQEAVKKLAEMARQQSMGWLKEKQVHFAARRIRTLMGARESPKFFAIRTMGIGRQALLDVGREFVEAGTIQQPEDLVYLKLTELEALSRGEDRDWRALVAERRAAYEREQRRRQVPRVLASDGRAFYEGLGGQTDSGDTISGSPVSPGVVEGLVRVVLNPNNTQLAPGEILVCPGTDPAWTPLFLQAGGLITEVGGLMTHGSVVAREYGIPAVVGVHQATRRLKDGDRIRLDGTNGRIVILRD
jgi:phosphohistidine swiveling domain-containing protein